MSPAIQKDNFDILSLRVGIWIPGYLQGNALQIEESSEFKMCLQREIKATSRVDPLEGESRLTLFKDAMPFIDNTRKLAELIQRHVHSLDADYVLEVDPQPEGGASCSPGEPDWEYCRIHYLTKLYKDGRRSSWCSDKAWMDYANTYDASSVTVDDATTLSRLRYCAILYARRPLDLSS